MVFMMVVDRSKESWQERCRAKDRCLNKKVEPLDNHDFTVEWSEKYKSNPTSLRYRFTILWATLKWVVLGTNHPNPFLLITNSSLRLDMQSGSTYRDWTMFPGFKWVEVTFTKSVEGIKLYLNGKPVYELPVDQLEKEDKNE